MAGSHDDDIAILTNDDRTDGAFEVNSVEIFPEFYVTTSANSPVNRASFLALQTAYTDLKKRYNDLEQRGRIMQKALNDFGMERFEPQNRQQICNTADAYDSNGIPSMAHAAGATASAELCSSAEMRARQGYVSYLERELMKVNRKISQLEMDKQSAEAKFTECLRDRDRIHADLAVITESLDMAKEQHKLDRGQLELQLQELDVELQKSRMELRCAKENIEAKNAQIGSLTAQMNDAGHFSLTTRNESAAKTQKCQELELELAEQSRSLIRSDSELSQLKIQYRTLEDNINQLKEENNRLQGQIQEQSEQLKDRRSPTDQMSLSAVQEIEEHKREMLALQEQVMEQQKLIQTFIGHMTASTSSRRPLSPRPQVPGSSTHLVMSEQTAPPSHYDNVNLPPTIQKSTPEVKRQRHFAVKSSGPFENHGMQPSEIFGRAAQCHDELNVDSDHELDLAKLRVQLPPPQFAVLEKRPVSKLGGTGAVSKSYPLQEGRQYHEVDCGRNTSPLTRTRSTPPSSTVTLSSRISQSYDEVSLRKSHSAATDMKRVVPPENPQFKRTGSNSSPNLSALDQNRANSRKLLRDTDIILNGSTFHEPKAPVNPPNMHDELDRFVNPSGGHSNMHDELDRFVNPSSGPFTGKTVAARNVYHENQSHHAKPVLHDKLDAHERWEVVNVGSQQGALTVQVCPVCTQQFPRLTMDQFQTHVFECFDNVDDPPETMTPCAGQYGDRQCPMCEAVFPLVIPHEEYERHVQEHFGEDAITDRFEILNP